MPDKKVNKGRYPRILWRIYADEMELGYTEVAKRTGVSITTLHEMDYGCKDFRISSLLKLANFFKCGIDELVERKK